MAGYLALKSLSLRERRWTFAAGLEGDGAVAVQLQLDTARASPCWQGLRSQRAASAR